MDASSTQRSLMFGIFAVQMHKVNAIEIAEAAAVWANRQDAEFAELLEKRGAITSAEREFISRLVDAAVVAQGNNTAAALNSIGGADAIAHAFRHSIALSRDGEVSLGVEPGERASTNNPPHSRPWAGFANRYTDEFEFARGGMGRVLIAHDAILRRKIALKELLPPTTRPTGDDQLTPMHRTADEVARFLREARVASQLQHPSIVPVYELGQRSDGMPYYTMKLVEGMTLAAAIRAKKSIKERLGLLRHFLDLCEAVAYAHSRGVIHRDLKPNNVMVGEFGETVLIDWGLARVLGQDDIHADELREAFVPVDIGGEPGYQETQYGKLKGTLPYMSPEQVRGDIDLIDERSDVYALGAVLYEILTGQPPFVVPDVLPIRIRKLILEYPPELPGQYDSAIPVELSAICLKAMSKNPSHRYPTAKSMAQDVLNFATGQLVEARQYRPLDLLLYFSRRYRRPLVVATLGSVVLGVVAGFYGLQLHNSRLVIEAQSLEARQHLYYASIAAAQTQLADKNFALARETLRNAPIDQSNWEWGYLQSMANPGIIALEGHSAGILMGRFSPDGSRILTVSSDHTGRIWDSRTGKTLFVLEGHQDEVQCGEFSPDGKKVLTVSDDSTGRIWDAFSGQSLVVLEGHTASVPCGKFSPDGTEILTTSKDATARLWDATTGASLAILESHTDDVNRGTFSPDGTKILTVSDDETGLIWDAQSGERLYLIDGHNAYLSDGEFSPDGTKILTVSGDSLGGIWALDSDRPTLLLEGHEDLVTHGEFSADGNRVLTVSFDGTGRVWDAVTAETIFVLKGHAGEIHYGRFCPDGSKVLTVSEDATARLWDAATGKEIAQLAGHGDGVNYGDFSPDGTRILTVSSDTTGTIWNTEAVLHNARTELVGHTRWVWQACFSPENSKVLSASQDGTARIWDAASGQCLAKLEGHESEIRRGAFSPDGGRVLTTSGDGTARIWDVASGQSLLVLRGHTDLIPRGEFSPDGKSVVTASWDHSARIWDSKTGALRFVLEGHTDRVWRAEFNPLGTRVLTVSDDHTARIWDATSGQMLHVLAEHLSRLSDGEYSPDGTKVLTVSGDATARIWDAESGQVLLILKSGGSWISDGVFSPDSTRVLTVSGDATGQVWDTATGECLFVLRGHKSDVNYGAFSPDGTRILTVGGDATGRIWDAVNGHFLAMLEGHTGTIWYGEFSPDGTRILTTSEDNTLRIWDSAPWRLNDPRLPKIDAKFVSAEAERGARLEVWNRER